MTLLTEQVAHQAMHPQAVRHLVRTLVVLTKASGTITLTKLKFLRFVGPTLFSLEVA